MADLISDENKLKVISHSKQWSEAVADLIPYEDTLYFEGNISFNIMVRGGAGFDPL